MADAWIQHATRRCEQASRIRHARSKPPESVLNLGFSEWDERASVEQNRRRFQKALGGRTMTLLALSQIHSDIIHVVRSAPEHPLQGDALVTATPGLLLAVQTADCIPILLADPEHRIVAAIHAGWRGTLKRIAEKTVGRMRMLFGTRPENIIAALGPGIGRCCYEVGPEVVKEFASQFDDARDWFDGPYDALSSGEDPNPLPWLTMIPPGINRLRRRRRSIFTPRIADSRRRGRCCEKYLCERICTSCRTDLLLVIAAKK